MAVPHGFDPAHVRGRGRGRRRRAALAARRPRRPSAWRPLSRSRRPWWPPLPTPAPTRRPKRPWSGSPAWSPSQSRRSCERPTPGPPSVPCPPGCSWCSAPPAAPGGSGSSPGRAASCAGAPPPGPWWCAAPPTLLPAHGRPHRHGSADARRRGSSPVRHADRRRGRGGPPGGHGPPPHLEAADPAAPLGSLMEAPIFALAEDSLDVIAGLAAFLEGAPVPGGGRLRAALRHGRRRSRRRSGRSGGRGPLGAPSGQAQPPAPNSMNTRVA